MSSSTNPASSLAVASKSPAKQVVSTPQSVTPSVPVPMVQASGSGHHPPMIKLTNFQGKEGKFPGWSKKFLIRSTLLNYVDILEGRKTPNKNNKAESDMQLYGYNDLLMASTDSVAYSIVSRSVSDDFPIGCLRTAWLNLNTRFNPQNGANMVRLKRKFVNLSLTSDQDPAIWMMESEEIKNQVDPDMTDQNFLIHLISHLPPSYDDTVNLLEMKLLSVVEPLNINQFRQVVCARYDRIKHKGEEKKAQVAFFAGTNSTSQQPSTSAPKKEKARSECTH